MIWDVDYRPFIALTGLLAVCCGWLPGGALPAARAGQPATLLLEPSADTSIFSEGELSNGGGIYLFTGLTVVGAERRALLAFDLSALPAGATIDAASLDVTVSRTISQTITVRLHRLLASWTEGSVDAVGQEGTGAPAEPGDATWLQRELGGDAWSSPGADYVTAESARTGLRINGRYSFTGGTLVDDVQRWVDNPQENFGWILIANPAAGFGSAKRLNSRENPDPASRPRLAISYTAPAGVAPPQQIPLGGGWWLVLLGTGVLILGRPFVRR